MSEDRPPHRTKDHDESSGGRQASEEPALQGRARRRYDVDIYRAWCKACGICAAFCPRQCIRLDDEGSPVVAEADRCTGCGWCELHCPDFAINVHERKASRLNRVDLD
jgi:2-oxoglutarate ferredoxin oxidoreductase subunit delta